MCFLADLVSAAARGSAAVTGERREGGGGGAEAARTGHRQVPGARLRLASLLRTPCSDPQVDLREDVVDADDAVRAGGAAVVHDGGVALHPHPASVLCQEAVVLGGHLPFHQHCGNKEGRASAPLFSSALGSGYRHTPAPDPPELPDGVGIPLASHGKVAWTDLPMSNSGGDPQGRADLGPCRLGHS